jgi:hypothetical protein
MPSAAQPATIERGQAFKSARRMLCQAGRSLQSGCLLNVLTECMEQEKSRNAISFGVGSIEGLVFNFSLSLDTSQYGILPVFIRL